MTGGTIQLAAIGAQDKFLTQDPQITFFKVVYRRHTNFSIEAIPQFFTHTPEFGKKVSCIVSRNGDLIGKIYLVVTLPKIQKFLVNGNEDKITKFAWIRKVGFGIIKNLEVEIGGQSIDKQYGEWLNIWFELLGPKSKGFDKMIGDIDTLRQFSNGKDEYTLYVPLQFWFCRASGLALPLISLQYSEVKINLELQDVDKCYLINPTHYISMNLDLVNFKQYEYIEQNVDNVIASGLFDHYDPILKRMYYMKISSNRFKSITLDNPTVSEIDSALINSLNTKYVIRGITSKFIAMPQINTGPITHSYTLATVSLKKCFLLIDYIYIDEEERQRVAQGKHEYLIDTVDFIAERTVESANRLLRLDIIHPTKLLVWVVQLSYLLGTTVNDHFNYTDSYIYENNKQTGGSIILNETLLLNGKERIDLRSSRYFTEVQPYQHFRYSPTAGINVYSFSLYPTQVQPSGTCNMSQIDNVSVQINLNFVITVLNTAKFKAYGLNYNILRIANGLGGLVFTK
jgi:hypothetical protein